MSVPGPSPAMPPSSPAPGRGRWQVGLRTLVLLTAAVAVWMSYALERRRIAELTARIASLRPLVRELVVDDPAKIAVVKQDEFWFDENRWEIHLPAGRAYRLGLATRGIADGVFPPPASTAPLAPGRYVISVHQFKEGDGWRIAAECGGTRLLSVAESKEWDPGHGSMGGGNFPLSAQFAPERPLILFQRQFLGPPNEKGVSVSPSGPAAGLMLWIEPEPAAATPLRGGEQTQGNRHHKIDGSGR